jgi:hypothetical protein
MAVKAAAGKGKKEDGGHQFKAVLISGPPGVGKSSSAKIVAEEMGYDVVEMNARFLPHAFPMRFTTSTMTCCLIGCEKVRKPRPRCTDGCTPACGPFVTHSVWPEIQVFLWIMVAI